jgi:hypothetical protein
MSLTSASPEQIFYLADLALFPQAHRQMFQADDAPTYQLLYLQTAYRQHAMHGPLLILPSTPLGEATLARWVEQGMAVAIHSKAGFPALVEHWRGLTQVRRQDKLPALFRYADPRLYAGLERALSQDDITCLLGPARLMQGGAAGHAWCLELPNDLPPASSSADFILTSAHERAIQTWREAIFSRQLAGEHALPEACVTTWLGQMKELALPTEYAQWEGCRTLAEAGCSSPLTTEQMDILKRQTGPWQQRLQLLRELAATLPNADELIS